MERAAFQLLDTGGIDEADPSDVGRQVAAQALRGVEEADLAAIAVDVTTAPTVGTSRSPTGCAAAAGP